MKKIKKKRSVGAKILISCLVVALVIGLSYLGYYLIRYTFYDAYKDDYVPITYAEGREFSALADSSRPVGLAESFVLAAESDNLKLYYDEMTTQVAVFDKVNSRIIYSNPQNVKEEDYDNNVFLTRMMSQLIIYYYPTKSATAINEMSSYQYCTNVELEEGAEPQFRVESIDNGIRVFYTIGDLQKDGALVPQYITEATFKDILEKLDQYDKENSTRNRSQIENVYGESKELSGYYQLSAGVRPMTLIRLQSTLELIGWTEEDYVREMEGTGAEIDLPTSFTIPLEYSLVDDKLQVNISTDHIEETGTGSLIYMDVLPYFDAAYHSYTTDNYVGYLQVIDNTATAAVAVDEISDYFTVAYDGETASVSIDNSIAGEYTYVKFTVYEAPEDESNVYGAEVASWNSMGASTEFSVEPGKYYQLSIVGTNGPDAIEQTEKFIINPEELPVDGYYLVPNGSGSLINLNSEATDTLAGYSENIYGRDDVMFDTETRVQETVDSKLPVYGYYDESNGNTTFVILTRGESLAELHVQTANDDDCRVAGSLTNYNIAYCRYYLRAENVVSMSTTDSFNVWTEDIFDTQITQQYCFLDDEHNGYSGMANYYRDYLEANGKLVKSESVQANNVGMYLDLLGAVYGDGDFLGFAYQTVIPLTTFDQAKEIVQAFYGNDVNNLIINYQGWMNDGYYHNTIDDIKVIRKLGGKKGLSEFTDLVESNGGKVYGDMAVNRVTYAADDFPYTLEGSRIFGLGYVAGFGKTSPTTYSNSASLGYISNLYDVLSPKYMSRYIDSSLDEMSNINVSGISYRDLGTYLYSDMKKTEIIHRERSKEITIAQLEKAAATGKPLMMNAPLAYAIAYSDDIINVPIGDNNYIYVDYEVPFYEMVIHGYVNYAGNPINLSADTTTLENILECVEYGANPHFTFTYVPATEMKYTALNNMYATNYVNWVDEAVKIYDEVSSALSLVSDATIVNHEILDSKNEVKRITYSNGVVITVNYSDQSFALDGGSISPKNFIVEVAE